MAVFFFCFFLPNYIMSVFCYDNKNNNDNSNSNNKMLWSSNTNKSVTTLFEK